MIAVIIFPVTEVLEAVVDVTQAAHIHQAVQVLQGKVMQAVKDIQTQNHILVVAVAELAQPEQMVTVVVVETAVMDYNLVLLERLLIMLVVAEPEHTHQVNTLVQAARAAAELFAL